MAPPKVMLGRNRQNNVMTRTGVTTRSQSQTSVLSNALKQANFSRDIRTKRKAEASPFKEKITTKRSALGNITNAIGKSLVGTNYGPKKVIAHVQPLVENIPVAKPKSVVPVVMAKPKLAPSNKFKNDDEKADITIKIVNIKSSLDSEKSDDNSLYVSALEDVTDSTNRTLRKNTITITKVQVNENEKTERDEKESEFILEGRDTSGKKSVSITANLDDIPLRVLPKDVKWDFDVENWLDPFQVSQYAMDIFEYLKQRECLFPIGEYMEGQVFLSRWMRAMLVDWMVEVQESFELNHETLYLAVKLVDLYLTKVVVGKETLQLLGAASLFIASKFDERIPPMVEDFLYICDGAYSQKDLIEMEINILKAVNFDLGIPLSYRFLRRYARCAKVSMPTLTLARYILEYSLMDYSLITFSDSKMAAAALLLALRMKDLGGWSPTLEYYSGYKIDDIREICNLLNDGLHRKHKAALTNVRNKYSHKIFFEVAKLPLIDKLEI